MRGVLVDSSVWIDYFAGSPRAAILNSLIDGNLICVNDLILSELIPFLRRDKQIRLIELLRSVNNATIKINWEKIIDYQYLNLKNGINKVGIPDLIILQNVIDNDLELFTFDKHFHIIKSHIDFSLFAYES